MLVILPNRPSAKRLRQICRGVEGGPSCWLCRLYWVCCLAAISRHGLTLRRWAGGKSFGDTASALCNFRVSRLQKHATRQASAPAGSAAPPPGVCSCPRRRTPCSHRTCTCSVTQAAAKRMGRRVRGRQAGGQPRVASACSARHLNTTGALALPRHPCARKLPTCCRRPGARWRQNAQAPPPGWPRGRPPPGGGWCSTHKCD